MGMFARLAGVACTAAALTACSATAQSVPYSLQPLGHQDRVTKTVPVVDAQLELAADSPGSHDIPIRLVLRNMSSTPVAGVVEKRILAPSGFKIVDDADCTHSLANDLVCEFTVNIAPGSEVSRVVVYKATKDPGESEAEFTIAGSDTSLAVVLR